MRATRDALGELILAAHPAPADARSASRSRTAASSCSSTARPADPGEALTHDMSDEEINALLGDDPADVVVCGASHVPFDRMVGGVRIVNVGSVGEAPGARACASRTPRGSSRRRAACTSSRSSSRSSSRARRRAA